MTFKQLEKGTELTITIPKELPGSFHKEMRINNRLLHFSSVDGEITSGGQFTPEVLDAETSVLLKLVFDTVNLNSLILY